MRHFSRKDTKNTKDAAPIPNANSYYKNSESLNFKILRF